MTTGRPIPPTPPGYMNTKEVAEFCGVRRDTIASYVTRGQLPQDEVVTIKGVKFYPAHVIEEFERRRERKKQVPSELVAEEVEHLGSIMGTEWAIRRVSKVYGLEIENVHRALRRVNERKEEAYV